MTHRSDFPYHELSVDERLLLVEDISDSIAADTGALELTEAQRKELDRVSRRTTRTQTTRSRGKRLSNVSTSCANPVATNTLMKRAIEITTRHSRSQRETADGR